MRRGIVVGIAVLTLHAGAQAPAGGTGVPDGYRPPPGMCRIWIDGVPADRQPAPTDCATAVRRRPANARVVFGEQPANPPASASLMATPAATPKSEAPPNAEPAPKAEAPRPPPSAPMPPPNATGTRSAPPSAVPPPRVPPTTHVQRQAPTAHPPHPPAQPAGRPPTHRAF